MTSVTFCACCGAGMLHVEAETCSSYCWSMLAVRRAQKEETAPVGMTATERMDAIARYREAAIKAYQQPPMISSAEFLARAERAVPPADAMFSIARDDGLTSDFYFGADIGIPRDIPTYELDQPEQYDRAPAVLVWVMGGIFVTLGILLIWAFS